MEEILYELRNHSAGLNAGRWDYIFSCIKKFKKNADFCLAQRSAPAMGGMSGLVPIAMDKACPVQAGNRLNRISVRPAIHPA